MRSRKVLTLQLLAVALLVPVAGCGALQMISEAAGVTPLEHKGLMPSDVHVAYAPLDEEEGWVESSFQVAYLETGLESYDTFFAEARRLEGTLLLARETVHRADSVTSAEWLEAHLSSAALSEAAGEEVSIGNQERAAVVAALLQGSPSAASSALPESVTVDHATAALGDHLADVVALSMMLPAAAEGLAGIPDAVQQLVQHGQGLVSSAPSDFAGPSAAHVPAIVQELQATLAMLRDLPAEATQLGADLGGLFSAAPSP